MCNDHLQKRLRAVFHTYADKVVGLDEMEILMRQHLVANLDQDEEGLVSDAMSGFYINDPAAAATTGQQDVFTPDAAGVVTFRVSEYKQGLAKMEKIVSGLPSETADKVITSLAESLQQAKNHPKPKV